MMWEARIFRGGRGGLPAMGLIAAGCTFLFETSVNAQTFITGFVKETDGMTPIANVNIDAFDSNGDEVNLDNDGTDGSGFFLTEFEDGPDVYDIRFSPPPGTPFLPVEIDDLFVTGTVNLGTVTLPDALLLSGRIINSSNLPIAGVQLRVVDSSSGSEVFIPNNQTDSLGMFDLQLAAGNYDLLIDPSDLFPTYAPGHVLDIALQSSMDLGDIVLVQGFTLSATVQRTNGSPVVDCDVDVVDVVSDEKLFTPGDSSDDNGFVDVVVPAGTLDVRFEPMLSDNLVGREILGVVVAADVDLGTVTLQSGFRLSGQVKDVRAAPVANVDIDVEVTGTGEKIYLYGDNTDGGGNYVVVVPSGVFDVDFVPPVSLALRSQLVPGVPVSSNKILNVTLEDCPAPANYGTGTPGSGGFVPEIDDNGVAARLGAPDFGLSITKGLGGAFAFLIMGTGSASLDAAGWTLWINPSAPGFAFIPIKLFGPNGVPGAGFATLAGPLPANDLLDGLHVYFQTLVIDPQGDHGVATSGGLDVTLCR